MISWTYVLSFVFVLIATFAISYFIVPKRVKESLYELFEDIISDCVEGKRHHKMKGAAFVLSTAFVYVLFLIIASELVMISVSRPIQSNSVDPTNRLIYPSLFMILFLIISGLLISRAETEVNEEKVNNEAEEIIERINERHSNYKTIRS